MASILAGLATAAATAKAVKELADKATGGKVSGTVSRITGGGSAREERETRGGGTTTIRSTPATNGYPDGPYTQKYTGGNAELDAKLADLGQRYNAARDRALAGDKSAVTEMRNLNDWANQYRNQYGYAAEYAVFIADMLRQQALHTILRPLPVDDGVKIRLRRAEVAE